MSTFPRHRFLLLAALATICGCSRPHPASDSLRQPQRGIITAPSDTTAVVGRYYRSLGCSVLYLTLAGDGTYFAELEGLATGESRGRWHLDGSQVRFDLPAEKTIATVSLDYFSPLDALKSDSGWALLPRPATERQYYENYGISAEVCFIKTKRPAK